MDNWLLIIVGVIFLVSIVIGYIRGFFRIGLSLLSSVLTIVIMINLSPYVSEALKTYTPAEELIEERIVEMFMPEITSDTFAGVDLTGTALEGLSSDELANLADLDWDQLGISAEDILDVIGDVSKDEQITALQESTLPDILKDLLLENNNSTVYEALGVDTFAEYVAAYISNMVINILSFLVTFLLAIIIVRALMVAVHILGELPGIGFVNHLGGAALGALMALIVVWFGGLLITVLYSSEVGSACLEMIEKSQILTFLYNSNPMLSKLLLP